MDCFSDIVCNVTEQEDGISDAFCANNGGAERYAPPISAVTKKVPLITRACSDANTDAEVANFGVLSPEGMTTDLPPRSVAFAIVIFSPAQSNISRLLPLGLTAQIQDDMGKLEVQTTHTLKKAWNQ